MSKESDEWYTPDWIAYQVQSALGDEIFDPCFKEGTPMAKVCCNNPDSPKVDATKQDWWELKPKAWFLNPPYSNPMPFVESVIGYHEQTGAPGIVLVNSATSAKWYQLLLKHCTALCLPPLRIKFSRAPKDSDVADILSGKLVVDEYGLVTPGAPRYNNSIFYFGSDVEKFRNAFWPWSVLEEKKYIPRYT